MRPVVGPDQLPVEVVVLTLPVVAKAGLGVFVESAASCGKDKKKKREEGFTERGSIREKAQWSSVRKLSERPDFSSFKTNREATRVNIGPGDQSRF